ncbi:MAG TPA: hypothetical protein VGF82_03760 [Terracidiphilus sp.]|jgi:hypothetical protein
MKNRVFVATIILVSLQLQSANASLIGMPLNLKAAIEHDETKAASSAPIVFGFDPSWERSFGRGRSIGGVYLLAC